MLPLHQCPKGLAEAEDLETPQGDAIPLTTGFQDPPLAFRVMLPGMDSKYGFQIWLPVVLQAGFEPATNKV